MIMLNSVIDFIARTNLFNFVIFFSVILWICKKINVAEKLEIVKNDIAENIESSEKAKVESEEHLSGIEETIAHLQDEIDELIKKSEDNAKLVGEKIIKDGESLAEGIKENSQKLVENKTALLKNDILKRVSQASIEVARNHIINELNNNYDLHNKFIDESLEVLNSSDN